MTFVDLSEKARQVCQDNYHDCGGCPIRAVCIQNILPTKEVYNTWIKEINDAAEVIP